MRPELLQAFSFDWASTQASKSRPLQSATVPRDCVASAKKTHDPMESGGWLPLHGCGAGNAHHAHSQPEAALQVPLLRQQQPRQGLRDRVAASCSSCSSCSSCQWPSQAWFTFPKPSKTTRTAMPLGHTRVSSTSGGLLRTLLNTLNTLIAYTVHSSKQGLPRSRQTHPHALHRSPARLE